MFEFPYIRKLQKREKQTKNISKKNDVQIKAAIHSSKSQVIIESQKKPNLNRLYNRPYNLT